MKSVIAYYDELADDYDRDRFCNSYGRYVDALEREILREWLADTRPAECVDFGCGTGRLLDFAGTGVDGSVRMLQVAAQKHAGCRLIPAEITQVPLGGGVMQAGICLHVLMHLPEETIRAFLTEAARIVRPAGRLIVDIPSAPRRALSRRQQSGWHGDTAVDPATFGHWAQQADWKVRRIRGILMLPVHRIPSCVRPWLMRIDAWLGCTPLMRYASYYVIELERRR